MKIDRAFIEKAYAEWTKAPAGKKNSWRVDEEYGGKDVLIDEITEQVESRTLSFKPFKRYKRMEKGSRKERDISIAEVKYQVATYAVKLAIGGMLDAKLGYYQTAGVKDKGQKLVKKALAKWSAEEECTHQVKLDVRKCYKHITCELVMRILLKFVASEDVLYVAECLLSCYEFGVLEIGTYFSLLMANLVLSYAYHFIEGLHKYRRGKRRRLVLHQVWHLDDVVLVGSDKRDLKMAVRELTRYMKERLGLELKPWKVASVDGIEMLDMGGYRAVDGRVTLRKRLFLSVKRAFGKFSKHKTLALARRCCSYWGWLKHSDSGEFVKNNGIAGLLKAAKKMISRHSKRKEETCAGFAVQPS
ncbi:MAG: hypothetical protein IJ111_07765 [Eggerthellaceae bacterium]|nr:hypothetical protein [Eggerthellaceae bacterium]